ncbi:MAG: ATP-binding protein, partial [Anaerolineae bacterium]
TLEARALSDGERWRISVSDTGIGIPEEALKYIFDPFRQVDGTSRRVYGGTGLGLAIVYELVQTMKGDIKVESTPGEGSTFTVELPVVITVLDESPKAKEPASQ